MSIIKTGRTVDEPYADDPGAERFGRLLDGLLAVPHEEVTAALEKETTAKTKKKLKASAAARAGTSRKR